MLGNINVEMTRPKSSPRAGKRKRAKANAAIDAVITVPNVANTVIVSVFTKKRRKGWAVNASG